MRGSSSCVVEECRVGRKPLVLLSFPCLHQPASLTWEPHFAPSLYVHFIFTLPLFSHDPLSLPYITGPTISCSFLAHTHHILRTHLISLFPLFLQSYPSVFLVRNDDVIYTLNY